MAEAKGKKDMESKIRQVVVRESETKFMSGKGESGSTLNPNKQAGVNVKKQMSMQR